MMMKIVFIMILAATTLAGCSNLNAPLASREATDVKEVLSILHNAKKLDVQGDLPGRWLVKFEKYEPWVSLPLTVDSPDTIHDLEDLIRRCDFTLDQELTRTFRDGTTISAATQAIIEVDNRTKFYLLAEDLLICRDMAAYSTRRYGDKDDTTFASQVALLLKQFADRKTKTKMPNQAIHADGASAPRPDR